MVYDAKFVRRENGGYIAGGSGGKEVRYYVNQKLTGVWRAPQAIYALAASPCGRFGAAAGNGFGV